MSPTPTATASSWTCQSCGVCVSWVDGQQAPLPESWISTGEGSFCLKCRRERAAELAVESAPEDTSREELAKIRRASLIEFEVRRTPDLPNNTIARACRSSSVAVAKAREEIESRDAVSAG